MTHIRLCSLSQTLYFGALSIFLNLNTCYVVHWHKLNIWWGILISGSIIWLSVIAGQLNSGAMWRLCPYFIPLYFSFPPCILILISCIYSGLFGGDFFGWLVGFFPSGSILIHCGCLTFSFFPQTYVKLNRYIKVNTFISRISILLLYTFPLFVVSNPVVLIVFLSIFCHLTFIFILCFLSFLIYLHLFPY